MDFKEGDSMSQELDNIDERRETVIAEEREQLREEFRREEIEYNEHLVNDEKALRKAVDERMEEYIDKHGDIR